MTPPTTDSGHLPGCRMPGCEGECTTESGLSPAEERLVTPPTTDRQFQPGEECPECHRVLHGFPCIHHEDTCSYLTLRGPMTPPTTDTEPAERPEPTTKAGQDMESWLREPEDYAWGRRVTNAILAIEQEAAERASVEYHTDTGHRMSTPPSECPRCIRDLATPQPGEDR